MRLKLLIVTLAIASITASAQQSGSAPTDAKAQRTYAEAVQDFHNHRYGEALNKFKKADKQDSEHCIACEEQALSLATQLGDFKAADSLSRLLIANSHSPEEMARAHYGRGALLLQEGIAKKKSDLLTAADQEFKESLASNPKDVNSLYADAIALARLGQDDPAREKFKAAAELSRPGTVDRTRALRFAARPELARERMAPAFALIAEGGQRVSLDDLQGKVVLLDFWATWCGPCREALPHMRRIAQKFSGEPLVILSISLDPDEKKWKDFIAKNEMTWLQYRDGGFEGPMARLFSVNSIPHTFSIDADGVLQEENVGDASIEGKLKKLISKAREAQESHALEASGAK